MADTTAAAFPSGNAALSRRYGGTTDIGMIEILYIAQLVRNPLQAMARRWWCKSLYRASRGRRRCGECTK